MTHPIWILQGICERACIFAFPMIAAYITSHVISSDDLTLEGSFGLGGAMGIFLAHMQAPWWIQLLGALAAGSLAGLATGICQARIGVNTLIGGMIVMTGLFSVQLKLAGANALAPAHMIFAELGVPRGWHWLLLLACLAGVIGCCMFLLSSEYGLFFRALGNNKQVVIHTTRNPSIVRTTALMIANGITACGGYLMVSHVGYFSIWNAFGTLIMALTGVAFATMIPRIYVMYALALGSIMYQLLISLVYQLQIDQDWNKLVTALCFTILLWIRKRKDRI